jgi:uncharacterized protein
MLRIEALAIDDHILDKIESRHRITFQEVEEVCYSQHHARRAQEGIYKVFGRTDTGRYVLVVLADHGGGVWKVVTARDMTQNERRLFRRASRG